MTMLHFMILAIIISGIIICIDILIPKIKQYCWEKKQVKIGKERHQNFVNKMKELEIK